MSRYFYCYSGPLKAFLLDGGHRFISTGIHPETNKRYWVFEGTKELNTLLEKWKVRKH